MNYLSWLVTRLPAFAQANSMMHTLAEYLIIAIIIGAILYIAQSVLTIPPTIMKIIWIIVGVVVAIIAIRFLVTLA